MRSESRWHRGAWLSATLLLALVACRGILEPVPRESPSLPPGPISLVVRVLPPAGVDPERMNIRHDNRQFLPHDDPLERVGNEGLDAGGRVVFENLAPGPTRLSYQWWLPGGLTRDAFWDVVEIPTDTVVMDLREPNLELSTTLSVHGQPLEVSSTSLQLRRSLNVDHQDERFVLFVSDNTSTEQQRIAARVLPGLWRYDLSWYFPPERPLRRISFQSADSLRVPAVASIDVSLQQLWLDLRLGGGSAEGLRFSIDIDTEARDFHRGLSIDYSTDRWGDGPRPILVQEGVCYFTIWPAGPTDFFPSHRLWAEVAADDTLRVDLGENGVEVQLERAGDALAYVSLSFDPQRQDIGDVEVNTDERGRARLFLPDGTYHVQAGPEFQLAQDPMVTIASDTLLTLEAVPR